MRNDQIFHDIQCLGIHTNTYALDYTGLSTKDNQWNSKKKFRIRWKWKISISKKRLRKMKKILDCSNEDKIIINITNDLYWK